MKKLENMTKEELLVEKAKIDYRLKELDENISKESANLRVLYDSIAKMIENHLGTKIIPLSVLKVSQKDSYRKLILQSNEIDSWININLRRKLRRIDRIKIYNRIAGLVCEYLEESAVIITAKSVINNLDKFQALFNRVYPGYISSGLAWFVFTLPDLYVGSKTLDDEDLI